VDSVGQNQTPESTFGGLDILLALRKDLKSLLIAPFAVGLVVYGLTELLPKTYTSVTVLNNMSSSGDGKTAAFANVTSAEVLLRTSSILDQVVSKFAMPGDTPSERRASLERKISVTKVRTEPAVTLSVIASRPETATGIAKSLINAWLPLLKPIGTDLAKLQEKIKAAENEEQVLVSHIKVLEQDAINKDTAIALVTLYTQQRDLKRELLTLRSALSGRSFEDVVLSGPTLPDEPQNRLIMLGPALGIFTAFLMVIGTIARGLIAQRRSDAANASKIDQMFGGSMPEQKTS
jgi:hypothetical protein